MNVSLEDSPAGPQWKRIGIKPRHGICLPLSALRSKHDKGIGEFFDLIHLIDWCEEIGMEVIQLLPLNDSGHDPSPYNALSSCALNPIYLSLKALPNVGDLPDMSDLNDLQRLSYHDVQSRKMEFLRNYFENGGAKLLQKEEYFEFIKKNPWVESYALFKVLKDRLSQNSWFTWPIELQRPTPDLYDKHAAEMSFYILLQYLSFLQLTEVKKYASSKNILLKGDIPILISRDSVDVWEKSELFDFNFSAGAPPDAYNPGGQYWGFPLFNWENVVQGNYSWWKRRLATAGHYYDLYRIDHVVGFFRIWAIPLNRPSKEGSFFPENPALWVPQGKEILLMMLASSPMLPIAEDLGTIPPSVRECLLELGICGTKVMRWELHYDKNKGSFIPIEDYPVISMTTVSTHDSETLQLWWQFCPKEAKDFAAFKGWTYSPDLTQQQRFEILHDAHHTPSLFHINLLQEYLAFFPELVWPNPLDERINIPGKILPTNWIYRFKPTLEEIVNHEELKQTMRKILK